VNTKITGVWDVVQCELVDWSHGFRGTFIFGCFTEQSIALDTKALCRIVAYVQTQYMHLKTFIYL